MAGTTTTFLKTLLDFFQEQGLDDDHQYLRFLAAWYEPTIKNVYLIGMSTKLEWRILGRIVPNPTLDWTPPPTITYIIFKT